MSDETRSLLIEGIAAAKTGELSEARRKLEWIFNLDPTLEEKIEAWHWLSEISTEPKEQRDYIEQILAHNPADPRARRKLAILAGRLNPDSIINPEKVTLPETKTPQETSADRFSCPQCGGRMTYTPDGQSLTCEYCEARQSMSSERSTPAPEHDFITAMATLQGHVHATSQQVLKCEGCGANFLLGASKLSGECPFCQSTYVVNNLQAQELIPPGELIPFRVDEQQAKTALHRWLHTLPQPGIYRVDPGTGVYLPAWVFSMGGLLRWRGEVYRNRKWMTITDFGLVMQTNLVVPASRRLGAACLQELNHYDLTALTAYDPRYLSNWLAETYQVNVGNASLEARQMALKRERERIQSTNGVSLRDLVIDTAQMMVDSFKLVLLPAWLTHIRTAHEIYEVIINGQNGNVRSEIEG